MGGNEEGREREEGRWEEKKIGRREEGEGRREGRE